MRFGLVLASVIAVFAVADVVSAQSIGTFRWQQQPYCNVVTVTITQVGSVYRLEGTDDQCGAPRQASASGMAFPNPDGTVGMGLALVTNAGGAGGTPLHIDATISVAGLSGTWRDSSGNTGAWVFTPGAGTGGSARPTPRLSFPGGLSVGGSTVTNVAAPAAATDATNKGYVDATARAVRSTPVALAAYSAATTGIFTVNSWGCLDFDTAASSSLRLDLPLPEGASLTAVRVKYRHSAVATGNITFVIRSIDFADGAIISDGIAGFSSSSPGSNGNRVETLVPSSNAPAVSATRTYYLSASTSSHTNLLAFCGATAFYTLP